MSASKIPWRTLRFSRVASTQSTARDLAIRGAPEGTAVVAGTQRAGRGRLGRRWLSPEGGLYLSFILRPSKGNTIQTLPLLASLAVAQAVRSTTGLPALVRWPNDVTISGKKVSGVLAESSMLGDSVSYVVVGIGINCSSRARSLSNRGLAATTLEAELGKPLAVGEVEEAVLSRFEELYASWREGRPLKTGGGLFSTPGRMVRIKLRAAPRQFVCKAVRVRGDGALCVLRRGRRSFLFAEDVEWLREGADSP